MLRKVSGAKAVSTIKRLRYVLGMLCSLAAIAAVVVLIPVTRGANPAAGSVSESSPRVTWSGQIKAPSGSSDCGGLTTPAATILA